MEASPTSTHRCRWRCRPTAVALGSEWPQFGSGPPLPVCLELVPQLSGGGVINQTSPDVVLMLLSPVELGPPPNSKTSRTRPPTAPAPTHGLIRLLSSFNISVHHKKKPERRGGEGRVQTYAASRTATSVNAIWVGRQTKEDN